MVLTVPEWDAVQVRETRAQAQLMRLRAQEAILREAAVRAELAEERAVRVWTARVCRGWGIELVLIMAAYIIAAVVAAG